MEPIHNEHEKPSNLIGELDKKLYSRKEEITPKERTILQPKKFHINSEWEEEKDDALEFRKPTPKSKTSVYSKILWLSLLFFVTTLLLGGYVLFSKRNIISSDNVNVSLSGPVSIKGGDIFPLQIQVENKNTVSLSDVSIGVSFPSGTRDAHAPDKEFPRYQKILGTMAPGEVRTETVSAILLGADNTTQDISVETDFGIGGAGVSYRNNKTFTVGLSSSPILIRADLVKEVVKGQEVTLGVDIESRSSSVMKNTLVKIDYPTGFVFESATPPPSFGNNVWSVGDMNLGDTHHIDVRGAVGGEDGQDKVFHISSGVSATSGSMNIDTLVSSFAPSLTISEPFLGASLTVNGSTDPNYVLTDHKSANIAVLWKNTLPDKITDATISVSLVGTAIDESSVNPKNSGLYDSSTHTIVWNSRTTNDLTLIPANKGSEVDFGLDLLPFVSGNTIITKNPVINIGLGVKGNRVSEQNVSQTINSFLKRSIKIGTTIDFSSTGYFYNSPIQDSGPLPPKVGKETTYTIIWTAKNTVNDISGAKVTVTLPSYVRFTGQVVPNGSDLVYNSLSGNLTWNIGSLKSGTGYEEVPAQVAFQIGIQPVLSQAGQIPNILSSAIFSGTDTFTGLPINVTAEALSTQLLSDPQVGSGQWAVEK